MAPIPPVPSSLDLLSAPRQALVVAMKNLGEATTEELARETSLSPGAVRAHLIALEVQGVVNYVRLRSGPGRPRHVFRLTNRGEELFPQQYARMANLLVEAIEAEDSGLVDRVFERLVAEQVDAAGSDVSAPTRPERLRELSEFVDQCGYVPLLEVLDNGPAAITLRHCPVIHIAREHPMICEIECRVLSALMPNSRFERVKHRLAGDPVCTYTITPD